MKSFILFFIFLSLNTSADDCGLYDINGFVRSDENKLILVAAEKTISEVKFIPHFMDEKEFVPFVDHHVTARIIVREPFVSGATILEIQKVKKSVPDPLNQNQSTVFHKKKKVTCPVNKAFPKKK